MCLAIAALLVQGSVAYGAEKGANPSDQIVKAVRASLDLREGYDTSPYSDSTEELDSSGSAVLELGSAGVGPDSPAVPHATSLIERALSLLGVTYRRGGSTPQSGLDCSGLVRLVFHDVSGLELPRRAEEISRIGLRVSRQDLRPGDLIFFNTVRRTISHVGIYLGDGQFIHAPASGGRVRIESMNMPYWVKRFSVARRVSD